MHLVHIRITDAQLRRLLKILARQRKRGGSKTPQDLAQAAFERGLRELERETR